MNRKSKRLTAVGAVAALGVLAAGLVAMPSAPKAADKYKIYLSMSYVGNDWQTESANNVKAMAESAGLKDKVTLETQVAGPSAERQIQQINAMVQSGAKGIVVFPISPTALNRVVKRGCEKGTLFFMYDATVTEPCAYNVSYLTAGFGENTAQQLANSLHGKGNIFMSRGVPGNSVDKRHYDGAMSVFKKYPGIHVVAEYYGYWDDRTTQQETAKALAAHPDVDGIWAEAGEDGAIKALQASGKKLVPITGENSNGFRLALGSADMRSKGLQGVSSGSPPATAAFAFKLMMEVLLGKRKLEVHNIEYPLPWVAAEQVKLCTGDKLENGCNAFPSGKVPDSFVTEVFNPRLLPELSLRSALNGEATAGATIQPLPADAVVAAPGEPGINCQKCTQSADAYKLTKVSASAK